MKKIILFFLLICLAATQSNLAMAAGKDDIKVSINGKLFSFPDQKPILQNGRIMIPVRFISENLGCKVTWDEKLQTVTISQEGSIISLAVGSVHPNVDGEVVTIDAPASLVGGRVMVPVRFVSEALGGLVGWSDSSQEVEIYFNPNYLAPRYIDSEFLKKTGYSREQVERALATAAIYHKTNCQAFNVFLFKGQLTSALIETHRELLAEWWGIDSREKAFESFKWLKEEGHRKGFDRMAAFVSGLTDEEFNKLTQKMSTNTAGVSEIKFVRDNYKKLQGKGITGWDLCRLAYIAQDCQVAGYITREEALNEIMTAAKMAQETFSSWEEMANSHLIGREYWSGESDKRFTEGVNWLLTNNESPWIKYKWDLSLEKQ